MSPKFRTLAVLAALAAAGVPARAQQPGGQGGVINLSCMEALVSIGRAELAGVFSFVADKDSPAAFADLVAHEPKGLKKYAARLEKDQLAAGGITPWDHEALLSLLALFSGPLADTLGKPSAKLLARLNDLSLAPTVPLETVMARRKKP
ncbi:MAG: hypothetical protein PHF00_01535 [Elusimicrobia bacterium]|nr:hypothetical protein [Elusimicrobiota bacterium]